MTLLPDWEPLHISDTFTPSILVDDQEGEKRTYWEKTLINIGPMSHRLAALPGKDVTGKNKLGSYKEIFYRKDELQKRVFLLGEAGAGKTTFSKHLVNLWCETTTQPQFSDVTVIKGFRYFFYVSCRFAKEGDIIADMIKDQIFGDDKLKDVATYMLEHYPECCLIVLDGADEWKGSATGRRGDIVGLPGMQGVEHCVILITSRPWRFHSLPTRSRSIFRRLQINGIKDVRVLAYRILQQLDDPDPKDSSYEFLRQIREKNMSELMKIPLILIIALGGWVDDKSLHRSITVNYINMIHSLISRSKGQAGWSDPESKLKRLIPNLDKLEAKWELQSNKLPDVFWRYESIQRFAGLFLSLGEIAFDLLLEKQEHTLVFSNQVLKKYQSVNDESVNVCLALGILSKTETTTRGLRKLESYAFCHKTFQEFFAALWLASKYSNEKSKLYKCLKSYRDLMSYEESIIFLCGFDPEAGKRFWMFVAEEVEIVEEDDKDVLDFERKRKVTEEVEIMEEDDKDVLDFERKRKVAEEVEIMEEDDKDVLDFERKRKVTEEVEIMEEDDKDVLDIERKRKVAEEVEIMEEDDKDVLDFERKRKVAEEVEIMEEDDKDVLDFERKRKVAEEVEIMEEDDKDVLDIERKRKVAEEVEIMEEDDKDVLDFERKRKVAEEVEIMEEDDKDVLDIERKRKVAEEVEIIEEADKDVLDFERKRKVTEEVEIMEEDDKDVLDIERKRKVAEEVEIMEEDDKDVLDFERKRKVAEEVEIIEEADKDVLDFERKRKVTEEVEIIEEADKDVLDFERKRKVAEEVEIVEEDDKDVLDFERKRKVAEEVEIVEEDDKDVLDFERKRKVAEEVEIVEEADKDVLDFERLVKDVRDVTKDLTYLVRMVRDLQVKNVQDLVCKCMKEHGFDQKDQTLDQIYFCIPHIVIVNNTSNEDIMLLCHVMEEYPCNVKSLYVDNCQSQLQTLCSGLQSLKLSHLPIVSEHIDSEHSDSEHRHSVEYLPSVSKQRDSEPSDSEPSDSEHSHSLSSPVLDLQKHDKLETLRLLYLSIEGLLLPVEGARITSLTLYKVTLTHHGCELLSESLSSCSHLEDLVLIGVRCREHSDSSCIPVLDLQKHDKLKTLALRWLSIEGLLLPVEEARITWLKLDDVTMTHHGCEQLSGFFSSRPELRNPGLISVKCREHKDSPCQAIKDIRNLK